jgi:hypothetical protein
MWLAVSRSIFGDAGSYKPPSADEVKARNRKSRWGDEVGAGQGQGVFGRW